MSDDQDSQTPRETQRETHKERAKRLRKEAYQKAKSSPAAVERRAAAKEKARVARKEAYQKGKAKAKERAQSAKDRRRSVEEGAKEAERAAKADRLKGMVRRGAESGETLLTSPLGDDPASPRDRPHHLRLAEPPAREEDGGPAGLDATMDDYSEDDELPRPRHLRLVRPGRRPNEPREPDER